MPFPILSIILLFIVFMTYRLKSIDVKERHKTVRFWDRESDANRTRKQSLENLNYIELSLESLPIMDTTDKELLEHQQVIRSLADKKIVNFSGKTNTDLKLAYGAPNLELLSSYDQNFTLLIRELSLWGKDLYEKGYTDEAVTVLEYGVSCRSDISANYTLLATIYKNHGEQSKINSLIQSAQFFFHGMMKPVVLECLQNIADGREDS